MSAVLIFPHVDPDPVPSTSDDQARDTPDVELTQYHRGADRGVGLQLLVATGTGYTYLTPEGAARLGAVLTSWARSVRGAA